MSKTYLITLTPTGKFFFGGDMTFTVNNKETQFTSYIIRSSKFPQQTSLLGMLRFLILSNDPSAFNASEQKIQNPQRAEMLIGPESFRMGKTDGYGKIKKIYPCFIQKDGMPIRYLERDYKFKIQFADSKGHTNKKETFDIPEIIGYNSKDGIPSLYLIDNVEVPEDDIFVKDVSNGINRDITTGKVDDNAYFKQICYRFNDKLYKYGKDYKPCQYRFAFYAEMDLTEEEEAKYKNKLVSVGGDNSQFILDIKPDTPEQANVHGNCVVLESPAFIAPEDLKNVCFAITSTIPFKCMQTETKTVQAYNKSHHQYAYINKGLGVNLYDRGSVFYFRNEKDAADFGHILQGTDVESKGQKSHADFYQIGYNHFRVK